MNICKAKECNKPSGPYVVCRYHYFMLPDRLRQDIRRQLDEAIEYIDKLEHGPPVILYSCKLGGPE